ncbi:uncharacterized protein [Antedon mediterranea]|uniref:uncharacterized protein n=1 Tax=Antedon mediterranea TaxID=105859 RepID=UPI003AF88186
MASKSNNPVRVMMWSTPRSLSTAIARSIVMLEEAQVFNEMYSAVFNFRKESNQFPISSSFSYEWAKSELEKDYLGKHVIFGKDFAHAVRGNMDLLPSGFTHTFLIRNPKKVVTSLNRVIKKSYVLSLTGGSIGKHYDDMILCKEMWDLYVYARDTLHQNPIVIDADDFLKDPEAMMKLYCDKTAIPFRKTMLKWQPTNIWRINWRSSYILTMCAWWFGYYGNSLNSTGFQKADKQTEDTDLSMIDEKSLKAINDNMEYYHSLYANRLVLK